MNNCVPLKQRPHKNLLRLQEVCTELALLCFQTFTILLCGFSLSKYTNQCDNVHYLPDVFPRPLQNHFLLVLQ